MIIDKYGRAYTHDYNEAIKYRVLSANYKFKPEGAYLYEHLFTKIKKGLYVLPVCLGQQHRINNKRIEIKENISLRKRQEEAINYLDELFSKGEKSMFVVAETGTGKSYAILGCIGYLKTTTVVIAPKKGILSGLYNKLKDYVDCKIMTAGEIKTANQLPDVLLTTTQSFNFAFDIINNYYNVLLIDEAHKMPKTRIKQVNTWKGIFVVGFTATPQRADFNIEGFEMLFKNIFISDTKSLSETIVVYEYEYNYGIDMLVKASEGLSPGHPEIYRRLFAMNDDRNNKLLDIIGQLFFFGIRRIIVFVDRDKIVETLREKLKKYNLIELTGKTKNISEKIELANNTEEYVIIGNTSTAGEGVDINNIQIGILFVSTSNTVTIVQTLGRMKRADGKKDRAYLIDFADTIHFAGSKAKKLGGYNRRKIYKEKGYEIISYKDFISYLKDKCNYHM